MRDVPLKDGERIDDLQIKNYRLIQKPSFFCFGMDAVLLSGFAKIKKTDRVLDMGTGNGVLPILLAAKNSGAHITGLEIQPDCADIARRNVIMNELEERIEIVDGDIKQASEIFGKSSFDVIITNPPYMNDMHGLKNSSETKSIARHEIMCSVDDVIREASACLSFGGRFFMIHRPHRLAEIVKKMKDCRLEPKTLRLIHPYEDAEAKMFMVEGVKNGGEWLKVMSPLIIYGKDGEYTAEIHRIYGREV